MIRGLTPLQLQIMDILWERGEATVSDVVDVLRYERDLARTTIATILVRLERQGLVAHRKAEVSNVYHPTVSRDAVRRTMVSDLVDTLFRGNRRALVSHLLEESEQDPETIRQVMELIESHRRRKQR